MSVRTWSIRSRLVALVAVPIVCLVLFWGFANYLTLGDGVRLYNQSRLLNELSVPVDNVVIAVQGERRAGMVYLASPDSTHQRQLAAARRTADRRIAAFRSGLSSDSVRSVATDRMLTLAQAELSDLSGLTDLRSKVDHRSLSPTELMTGTAGLLDGVDPLYEQITTFPDDETGAEGRAVAMLSRAREMRSRTDAVLAFALAKGHFSPETFRLYVQAVGVERDQYEVAAAALPAADLHQYDALMAKAPFTELAAMERTAVDKGGPTSAVPVNAVQWQQANASGLAAQYRFEQHLYDLLGEHAKAPSYVIFLRLGLAGLLGLIAIVISVLVARRLTRSLIRQLRALRDSARDLAWVRLPAVVQRLSDGQSVDVAAEVPRLPTGSDEIGQVADAFNEVGRTAVQAASGQAELRTGAATMFLNIARRSQTLLHRQLGQLDVMERKAAEPEALDDLFKVDHLATRMRRNAENLVILGGGVPGRVWSEPKPLLDVLRSAASEVEQYERVHVLPFPSTLLAGSVISDVVHLVAELIDNATAFSPPHTRVNVTGQPVPKGFAIEIEDRGLGMSAADIESINEWLTHPPSFDVLALNDDARLGMFVVARIAARHEIKVQLRPSPYGGTTAIVLLPGELVERVEEEPPDEPRDRPAPARPTPPVLVAAGTRHRADRTGRAAPSGLPRLATLGAHAEPDPSVPGPRPAPAGHRSAPVPAEPGTAPAGTDARPVPDGPARLDPDPERLDPEPERLDPDPERLDPEPASTGPEPGGMAEPAASSGDVPAPVDDPVQIDPAQVDDPAQIDPAQIDDPASVEDRAPAARSAAGGPSLTPVEEPAAFTAGGPSLTAVEEPARSTTGGPSPSAVSDPDRSSAVSDPDRSADAGSFGAVTGSPEPTVQEPAAAATGGTVPPVRSVPSDVDDENTHLGLPRRVRQANLAPGLRVESAVPAVVEDARPRAGRGPEEIRRMMSSYQQGTLRGRRTDAARSPAPTAPGTAQVADSGRQDTAQVADGGREDG
ncbi:histidine kinase [Actinocatenispora thailandica]|uniref:histidine kinase n=1 Tax=Actinocatenispora thailandica TaxID=227318 RepID=A0A7R7HUR5_9ACTN|nr:nitrate- and nitrite sensing domain-containing protein [Actinocatenispora thailandica]BCJ32928.1 histidine kinase [Actinocatenispora thailandica]